MLHACGADAGRTVHLSASYGAGYASIGAPSGDHLQEMATQFSTSSDSASVEGAPMPEDLLVRIARLQEFNGAFRLNQGFANAFGVDLEQLRLACKSLNTSEDRSFVSEKIEDVWATVLAIVYFELKLKNRADEWDLIVEKSGTWLASMIDTDQLQNIRCTASSFLQKCDRGV